MKQIKNVAARLITLGRRIIPISALLCFVPVAAYSGEAETAQSVQGKAPCDWLQEVKRTNTWLERDQEGRRAASILQKEKRMGKPITDQQVSETWGAVASNDKVLQGELDDLVARCGWPTTSGYGDKAPQYAAFIVQHADLAYQERYLPLMQSAVDTGELAARHLAMLVDRILTRKELPQRYGTQLTTRDGKLVVYPIEDPEHVDERRATVAMIPASFCAYIAMFEPTPQSDLCKK